jgi:hypothetical protein
MSPAHPALSAYVVRRLTLDTDPYLSCDDCFDMVDGYGEALLSDHDHDLPAMRTHLAGLCRLRRGSAPSSCWSPQDGLDAAAALLRIQDDLAWAELLGSTLGRCARSTSTLSPGGVWRRCRSSPSNWLRQVLLPGDSLECEP